MPSPLRIIVTENYRRVAFWRAVACELLGTAILVFLGCGSVILQLNPDAPTSAATTVKIALSFGFAVNILIKIFGPISGCHINPAVSISFMIVGKVSVLRAACYTVAQLVGSIIGAGLLYGVQPPSFRGPLGNTRLLNDISLAQGCATEAILVYILVLAISSCLDEKRIDHFKMKITNPLTIGFTVSALHLVGIPFTGSSLNPARSFGPSVVSHHWANHWVYWVGPIVGACLASLTYYFLISPQKLNPSQGKPTDSSSNEVLDDPTANGHSKNGKQRPAFNTMISVMSTVSETVDVPLETYNCAKAKDFQNGAAIRSASPNPVGKNGDLNLAYKKHSTDE